MLRTVRYDFKVDQHEQCAHKPLDFVARPSAYYAALSLMPAVL